VYTFAAGSSPAHLAKFKNPLRYKYRRFIKRKVESERIKNDPISKFTENVKTLPGKPGMNPHTIKNWLV
jgi:hypothetical protein